MKDVYNVESFQRTPSDMCFIYCANYVQNKELRNNIQSKEVTSLFNAFVSLHVSLCHYKPDILLNN